MSLKKNYGLLTMMILLLSLAIFAVKGDIFRKPQQIMPEDLDLAGGPEKEVRGFPKREMVDLITMYPELFIASGDSEEKKVALTFDDGPDDIFTPQILDVLKEKNVKATFFVIGKRAEGYPKVMRRIVDESHLVGNHTWSHPNIMKISLEDAKQEVLKTEKLLKSYCDDSADRIKIFRSPYGSIDPERVEFISNIGYKIIAWNVDSLDWKGLSAEEVKTNVLENVTEGSIILQHSAGGEGEDLSGSVEALPEIIDVLKEEGFEFVTIDEILKDKQEKDKKEKDKGK
ncbi:MAG: polysaccharide deacetylase family protein [Tepidanaerobacteraceae bacterium]|jgi:peptidoglycan/xylan/chitin deacetylase (PgdA/CDA1 family)|nr:polysaccharide deacetylase family protein [Tepidanaerobacter sp.]HQE06208.1 polysaccharide deacetylase family protein [Tepidanaerobacteraceae bacterium]